MKESEPTSIERAGFTALVALLLSPIIAHGVWRPLVHIFGPNGNAVTVTGAALATASIIVFAWRLAANLRLWLPLVAGGLSALAVSTILSLGMAGLLTLIIVTAAIASLVRWLPERLPPALDGILMRSKALSILYLIVALFSIVSVARVSTFIGDPTRGDLQALPGDTFVETHSCLTAYVRAFELVRAGVDNVYDHKWWHGSLGLPPLPAGTENPYSPFSLDSFIYPPPFLFLMDSLAWLQGDFLAQRALWFGICGLLFSLGLWVVASWMDGPKAHRILLLSPLFLGSMPVLVMLQIGNFHLTAVLLAILAMVAFDHKHELVGGALLALTILSKISPGIFGLVLLVQRRYRFAAITAGFGAVFLVISVLRFGLNPSLSFLTYALPQLSSGSIFSFMTIDNGILTNRSLFGFAFKLQYLGVELGDPWRLAQWIGRAYTLGLILLTVIAARKGGDRREQAIRWMSLLVVGGLQSPFSPGYVAIGLLWATILLSAEIHSTVGAIGLILLWPVLLIVPSSLSPMTAVFTMVQTVLALGICIWLIVRVSISD